MTTSLPSRRPLLPGPELLVRGVRLVRCQPDVVAVGVIATVAVLARLVLLFGAPVFVMKDSASYFLPGWDLAHGLDPDLQLRRTPAYPWLIAGVLRLFGDDLFYLALVQHALGVASALATYVMGRLVFGRAVGVVAGLLTAISAPLLIIEHYVMPEALVSFLLVSGVVLVLMGVRSGHAWWFLAAGIALGVAALTRPAAQLIVLGAPLALLAARVPLRQVVTRSALAVAGLAVVVLPWMITVHAEYGVFTTGATLGEPLMIRLLHHDDGFRLPDAAVDPYPEPARNEGRRLAIELAARRSNPSVIIHQLRRQLKLSRADADAVLRDLSFEMIRAQPSYYLTSTARLTARLFVGRYEALKLAWTDRRNRAGEDTLENWQSVPRIRQMIQPATPAQRSAYGGVERLLGLFQPYPLSALLGVLFLLGTAAAAARPAWRLGLLFSYAAACVILTCTFLAGIMPRYRFPADPFIYTMAAAGALACFGGARAFVQRRLSNPARLRLERMGAP